MWKSLLTIMHDRFYPYKKTHIVLIWTFANISEDLDFTQNTTAMSYTKCLIILLYVKRKSILLTFTCLWGEESNKASYKINKYAEPLHWY